MNSSKTLTFFLMLACFNFYLSIYAQECSKEKFVGTWKSGDVTFTSYKPTLDASSKNNYLTIAFVISQSNDTLSAKMKSPDTNVLWLDATRIQVSGNEIKLYFDQITGVYVGKLNESCNQLDGSLNFLGRMIPISLQKVE